MSKPGDILETPRLSAGEIAQWDRAADFSRCAEAASFGGKNRVVSTSENIMESLIMKGFCVCE